MWRATNIEWVPMSVMASYPDHILTTPLAFCNHVVSNSLVSSRGLIMLTNSQYLLISDLAYFLMVSN